MKNLTLLTFVSILLLSSCKTTKVNNNYSYFGDKITAENAISYDQLLKKLSTKDRINNVKVIGKIDGVCQTKGCWMNIVSEQPNAESMFVKFKDYGFFMPLDASGSTAIIEGDAFTEETSIEDLRHFAEDAGKSAEEIAKITAPITELKFLARGVIIK
ncbi:MAG: DUF4920 domain-containing protein [Saprospiraceae bacterium]